MSARAIAITLGTIIGSFRRVPAFLWRWEARFKGVELQGNLELNGRPIISVAPNSRLVLADGVRLSSAKRANPLACFQPTVLRTLAPGAELSLAKNVGLSGTVICAGKSIRVGEGTIFGSGAMVVDNDFHIPAGEWGWSNDANVCGQIAKPVVIGRGVFVGARAIVLKGVTIGDRAVIGAGAVVTKDVPAGHVAVGNPARTTPIEKPSTARA
jgi:acetyltransferase-like isoleucine patch superfamily enzyme